MWSGANGDGGGVVVGWGRGKEKGSLCVVQSSELASELVSEPRKSGYPSCIVRGSERLGHAPDPWIRGSERLGNPRWGVGVGRW